MLHHPLKSIHFAMQKGALERCSCGTEVAGPDLPDVDSYERFARMLDNTFCFQLDSDTGG